MSVALGYQSREAIPTRGWERLCFASAAILFALAMFGVIATGELLMIGAAAPFIAIFLGTAVICRARRIKLSKAREAFLANLKAPAHG